MHLSEENMKKLLLTTLCISSLFYYFNTQAKPSQVNLHKQYNPSKSCATKPTQARPIKIVVLTSKGGNGHMAACSVLKDALPDCEIKLVDPIHDTFVRVLDGKNGMEHF